jgi:hypothetical protein
MWWGHCGLVLFVLFVFSWFKLSAIEYNIWVPWIVTVLVFSQFKLQRDLAYNIFLFFTVCYPLAGVVFLATLYRFIVAPAEAESRGVIAGFSFLVIMSCTISAAMGIYRQMNNSRPVWGIPEEQVVNWILKKTSKDAVFLAPRLPMNPFTILTGRTMYIEHEEVMSHIGIDFAARGLEYRKFSNGNFSDDITKIVDYIIKPHDRSVVDEMVWREVFDTRDFTVSEGFVNIVVILKVLMIHRILLHMAHPVFTYAREFGFVRDAEKPSNANNKDNHS